MRLTRWEPFREMDDFFKGFAPLFGRMPAAPDRRGARGVHAARRHRRARQGVPDQAGPAGGPRRRT